MNYIIAGCVGFIGLNLTQKLLNEGRAVNL